MLDLMEGMFESQGMASAGPAGLPRHRYPWPIVAAAVVVVAAVVYSLVLAPTVVSTSRELDAGTAALHRGDYATAAQRLRSAYSADPSSHKVQLAYAEASFANGDPRTGLTVLSGVTLSAHEFAQLKIYMPARYAKYFEQTS